MSHFRRVLGIAGGVLLLLLVGVAIALLTVDPNQFVGPVLARVKAATGREVTVGGGIELKIGFAPKIVADDVRVGNAPWGKAPQLLSARQVEAQVALLPLLQRRFRARPPQPGRAGHRARDEPRRTGQLGTGCGAGRGRGTRNRIETGGPWHRRPLDHRVASSPIATAPEAPRHG